MAVTNQFKIVNNDNSKGLKFHYAKSTNDSVTTNSVSIALPGQDSASNYIANFGGFIRIISIDFVLYNDGTDKSTDGSSKVTLTAQWDHLMDTIIQGFSTSQSDVTFTITIYSDGGTKNHTGMVENINIIGDPTIAGNKLEGSLVLKVGTN